MKNTVRNRFVPRIFRVRISAMVNAITLIKIVETTVNAAVNQNAWANSGSVNAYLKFSKPTNVTFFKVVNLQRDKYNPCKKGHKKPMQNAATVGTTKIGQYFLIAFSTPVSP